MYTILLCQKVLIVQISKSLYCRVTEEDQNQFDQKRQSLSIHDDRVVCYSL